ncbi:hypothetical protein GCM10009839_93040 [Catenulispora yoronensis]|uniref:Uncharacterized protein n=1 Tax=Catenulispora yoronensis TaxID=450799 RepID=A0ABN2VMS4_9ACTN
MPLGPRYGGAFVFSRRGSRAAGARAERRPASTDRASTNHAKYRPRKVPTAQSTDPASTDRRTAAADRYRRASALASFSGRRVDKYRYGVGSAGSLTSTLTAVRT